MTAVAGVLARVSKLFVEGYISESEFAMPPEEDTEGIQRATLPDLTEKMKMKTRTQKMWGKWTLKVGMP